MKKNQEYLVVSLIILGLVMSVYQNCGVGFEPKPLSLMALKIKFDSEPIEITNKSKLRFQFLVPGAPDTKLKCRIVNIMDWQVCKKSYTTKNDLPGGVHVFEVEALNISHFSKGRLSTSWLLDTEPPVISVTTEMQDRKF